jgi:hypothetical protein
MISAYNYALSILQSSLYPHRTAWSQAQLRLQHTPHCNRLDSLFFILSFVFAAIKQSGHSHLQISTAEAIRIVCDSAAPVSPQTPPTNKKLHAQVGSFYQSSELFSGSTCVNHSKITC